MSQSLAMRLLEALDGYLMGRGVHPPALYDHGLRRLLRRRISP